MQRLNELCIRSVSFNGCFRSVRCHGTRLHHSSLECGEHSGGRFNLRVMSRVGQDYGRSYEPGAGLVRVEPVSSEVVVCVAAWMPVATSGMIPMRW